MNLFLGVTDPDWYDFLRAAQPAEVNFWRPGGQNFRALQPGEPFLFKLKAPYNAVGGGGFFVRMTRLPRTLVWDVFGQKNGTPDFQTLARKIRGLRGDEERNPHIGYVVLTAPFFFDETDWIPVPDSFAKNVVRGKTYDATSGDGMRLWMRVRARLQGHAVVSGKDMAPNRVAEELAQYGAPYVARNRLGQSAFRTAVTDAYDRRCAFTGEKTLPALQASHIKPYASSGPHRVDNGLLLRADLHQLFDASYMTVTTDHRIKVSRRIKEEFDNGDAYLALHGQRLQAVPDALDEPPSPDFIAYHRNRVFAP